jgi:hypothetical protein
MLMCRLLYDRNGGVRFAPVLIPGPPHRCSASANLAGIRAYEKAGFVEEGRHRESVLHDRRWYDDVLMSILDREWAVRRSGAEPG